MTKKPAAPVAAENEFAVIPAPTAGVSETGEDVDQTPEDCEDPDEAVVVEYEGRSYGVPKALKAALMRQADYTRKTQELAQQRKSVVAAQDRLAQGAQAQMMGLARVQLLDNALAPLHRPDWPALNAQNPAQAQLASRRYVQLKAARQQAAQALQTLQHNQAVDLQRKRARQIEESRAKLQKDVEDWSPDLRRKILAAGRANDFSEAELHSVTDPRMIKVLNKARQFDEIQAKNAAAKRLTVAQAAKPATEVGDKSPATNDPARMTTAEWMRWRANNLRKSR